MKRRAMPADPVDGTHGEWVWHSAWIGNTEHLFRFVHGGGLESLCSHAGYEAAREAMHGMGLSSVKATLENQPEKACKYCLRKLQRGETEGGKRVW
jgi:hypothetical protein